LRHIAKQNKLADHQSDVIDRCALTWSTACVY
jgi:hypothetical protein